MSDPAEDRSVRGNTIKPAVVRASEAIELVLDDGTIKEIGTPDGTFETLEATAELNGPTASEGDVVTVPDNPDVVPIFFDAQTGQPLVPDLEETV